MAKPLMVMRPVLPVAISAGHENLLTPNPKEIFLSAGVAAFGGIAFNIDMGAVVTLDTFFLGFTNLPSSSTFTVDRCDAAYNMLTRVADLAVTGSGLTPAVRHGFALVSPAPAACRYWKLTLYNNTAGAIDMGAAVLAVGVSFQCALGHEMGAGRAVEDTSTVERLVGGGFGINEGAIVGGYDWTFGDLTDAERDTLYALVRGVGSSRSLLVVEDPDQTAGLSERIHWGLFDRLEKYERQAFGITKWSLRIKDWG